MGVGVKLTSLIESFGKFSLEERGKKEKLKACDRDLNLGSGRTFVTLIKQCNCCLNFQFQLHAMVPCAEVSGESFIVGSQICIY